MNFCEDCGVRLPATGPYPTCCAGPREARRPRTGERCQCGRCTFLAGTEDRPASWAEHGPRCATARS